MAGEPTTVNVALIIPNTGDLVDTWGAQATNPDFVAMDGLFAGVQTVSLSNAPVTLSSPAGVTITPSPGPTESQNAVLRCTGVLSANVQVTLPLPGPVIVENLTTGAFVLSFRAVGSGEVIAIDQGECLHIYNDGTNVRFVDLPRIGSVEMWAGLIAMPAWVLACTKQPYLLNDGTVYNFSDFPYLGARLKGAFGGNGITTFGVPDHSGRVPLPYDKTGTRITVAGCGLNGQTLGAVLDQQTVALTGPQVGPHTHGVNDPQHSHSVGFAWSGAAASAGLTGSSGGFAYANQSSTGTTSSATGISIQSAGGGQAHPNVQPGQVTGISVIRAG